MRRLGIYYVYVFFRLLRQNGLSEPTDWTVEKSFVATIRIEAGPCVLETGVRPVINNPQKMDYLRSLSQIS